MNIECPKYINTAVLLLSKRGFDAYAVGGCVRDTIMGNTPNDWDMTTSATPEETIRTFHGYKTIPTGIKHGTVTVIIDGNPVEITTMRIDGEYTDNRRPDEVIFTEKIEEDLSRRDFTVNAMAYNNDKGIIDPFDGQGDIKRKIIKCVGNPDKRFNEDALRIIRALRFASVLGFDIDNDTAESIRNNYTLLGNVAKERIRVELIKLLSGKNVEKILTEFKDIFFFIIPQLKKLDGFDQHTQYHIYDVWTHTIKVVVNCENTPIMRVAALLHDVEKPSCFVLDKKGTGHFKGHPQKGAETAYGILKDLRFSNAEIKDICDIIALHDERPDGNKIKLAHLCSDYSTNTLTRVMKFIKAELYAKNPNFIEEDSKKCDTALEQIEEIKRSNIPLKTQELAIKGIELLDIGVKSNQIGINLFKALNAIIDEKISNDRESILGYIKEHLWDE